MNKFSVLMSVYHKEKAEYFRKSLNSIFNQTLPPTEVILVKDGELTKELDRVITEFETKYNNLLIVALPQNVGLGNALNEGLKHCSYNLVARMDSDDICVPSRFEKQLAVFEQDNSISIVGGWIEEFEDNEDTIISCRIVPQYDNEIKTFFKSKNPVNHMSVMFRKNLVIEVGGYQHFYLLEDYWLWARMIKANAKLYNIQESLVKVRGGVTMAARRGGLKYAMSEVKLQKMFLKMNLISFPIFVKNILIRFTIRIIPNSIRSWIYCTLLRKNIN